MGGPLESSRHHRHCVALSIRNKRTSMVIFFSCFQSVYCWNAVAVNIPCKLAISYPFFDLGYHVRLKAQSATTSFSIGDSIVVHVCVVLRQEAECQTAELYCRSCMEQQTLRLPAYAYKRCLASTWTWLQSPRIPRGFHATLRRQVQAGAARWTEAALVEIGVEQHR